MSFLIIYRYALRLASISIPFVATRLEALAVNDTRAALVVLLLRAPEVLERRERSENRTTDPDRVLALGRGDDLDAHARGRERGELFLHTVGDTGEHGGTTGEDDVAVEIATDIEIALVDGVVTVLRVSCMSLALAVHVLTSSRGYRPPQDPGTRAGRGPRARGS